MQKKWGIIGFVAILTGVIVVAFAGTSGAAEFNWKQAQGTEIRLLSLRAVFSDNFKVNLPEFEKLTGIKVIIEDFPEDPFRQKLAVEMSAKSKTIDVFSTGTMREGRQFSTSGWYADLTPLINNPVLTGAEWDKSDFIEAVWKAHQFSGKQVAIPMQATTQILYYRKDLLDAAGLKPPKTLDELEAAAKKLHNPPSVYGFVARGRKTQAPYTWAHWLYANGGSWLTSDGKPGINTPAAIAATQQYVRLLHTYSDPGVTDNGPMEVQTHFLQGRAAMVLDASSWAAVFSDPQKSKVVGKWDAALAPSGPAGVSYELWAWSLAISPFSEKQKAAWLFVQWATGKEIQRPLHFRSYPSPRKSLWANSEWKSKMLPGYYETNVTQLQKAVVIGHPPFVASPEVTDIVGIAINNALAGKPLKDEMDSAAKKMADVLEKTEPKR